MNENSRFLLFLLIGYGVVWVGIIGYVLYLGARLRAVQRDLEALQGDDSRRSEGPGPDRA